MAITDVSHSGRICLLDLELQGVKSIKKFQDTLDPRYVFVKTPTIDDLVNYCYARLFIRTSSINLN